MVEKAQHVSFQSVEIKDGDPITLRVHEGERSPFYAFVQSMKNFDIHIVAEHASVGVNRTYHFEFDILRGGTLTKPPADTFFHELGKRVSLWENRVGAHPALGVVQMITEKLGKELGLIATCTKCEERTK